MFEADLPITKPSQDLLKTSAFAHRIADSIFGAEGSEGWVIALVGQWGSGKTSIINMIERRISIRNAFDNNREYIKNLCRSRSSDNIDDFDDLISKYDAQIDDNDQEIFETYGTALYTAHLRVEALTRLGLSSAEAEEAERARRAIKLASEEPRVVVVRFSPWILGHHTDLALAYIAEVSRSIGERLGVETQKAIAEFLQSIERLSKLAGPVGWLTGMPGLNGPSKILGATARFGAEHFSQGTSLYDAKQKLRAALKKQKSRIVIVIDDLDRLAPSEAQLMISLVKSQMDLPNIVHLLAYDKKRLEAAIGREPSRFDAGYLEKVVQVELDLPLLQESEFLQIFSPFFSRIISTYDDAPEKRISEVEFRVLKKYISNARDIARLTNSLKFSWMPISNHVDALDFISIETLRLFDRHVYDWVRTNIESLNGMRPEFSSTEERGKEVGAVLAESKNPAAAKAILQLLFPVAARWMQVGSTGDNSDTSAARREFRICSPSSSATYFGTMPVTGAIGYAELSRLRASLANSGELDELRSIVEDASSSVAKNARVLILESIISDISIGKYVSTNEILNLLKLSDDFYIRQDLESGFLAPISNDERLRVLLVGFIESFTVELRAAVMEEIFKDGRSLTAVVELCRSLIGDVRPGGASGRGVGLAASDVQRLREIVLQRVRDVASTAEFWSQPDPTVLLWFWQQATVGDEVRRWLMVEIEDERKFIIFLQSAPSITYSTEGVYKSLKRSVWTKVADIDLVLKRCHELVERGNASSAEKLAAREFIEAVRRGDQ